MNEARAPRRIRYIKKGDSFLFGDHECKFRNDCLVLHQSYLDGISATDFRAALRSQAEKFGKGHQSTHPVYISVDDIESFDYEYSPVAPVSFRLEHNELLIHIEAAFDEYQGYGSEELAPSIRDSVLPILKRAKARLIEAKPNECSMARPWIVDFLVEPPTRSRTVVELFNLGSNIERLLRSVQGYPLNRASALDLLIAGRPDLLIGLKENEWLEAKTAHYDLTSLSGKVAIALAVARFANAEDGGLVVVGLRTREFQGSEVIDAVRPVPCDGRLLRRYKQAIEQHLFPPPDGLEICSNSYGAGHLISINVPPQPEELKPFLVNGAIVDGKSEGAFISIVRRRGDTSIPTTAAAIHSTLAAGRALLRRDSLVTERSTTHVNQQPLLDGPVGDTA